MAKIKMVICPWCGEPQPAGAECRTCHRGFDAGTRHDLLASMGPWFIRDEARPFEPGLRYERMVELVRAGDLERNTIVRGPTTRQLWTAARRTAGLAHLLGYCHACDAHVQSTHRACESCGAAFGTYPERDLLGLPAESTPPGAWIPPAPDPVGLSSFADDAELIGKRSSGSEARVTGSSSEGGGASRVSSEAGVDARTLALRKQVTELARGQRLRTIIIVVLMILLAVMVGLLTLSSESGAG